MKHNPDTQVLFVLKGYINLNEQQRNEFIDALNEFERGNWEVKRRFTETVRKISAGPLSTDVCACCGR